MLSESRSQDSKWAPYFSILPRGLDSLVFWSDAEIAELQASSVVNKIGKAEAERLFSTIPHTSATEAPAMEHCHRIASIIMAYAFDIPEEQNTDEMAGTKAVGGDEADDLVSDDEEDSKTILSMVPLADMLNADGDRNNARLSSDNEELEMIAIKPILSGEEVFNDYGQLPRSDLLRRYGYVTERYAPFDVAEIPTDSIFAFFQSEATLANCGHQQLEALNPAELQRRADLAEREGVLEESYDVTHASSDGPCIPDELLALIYILLLDDTNLESLAASETSLPSRSKLTSELAGKVLASILKLRENSYGTTLEEDEALLKTENRPYRATMALQVRLGEKQVLREAQAEARSFQSSNKRLRLLEIPPASHIPRVVKQKREGEDVHKSKKARRGV